MCGWLEKTRDIRIKNTLPQLNFIFMVEAPFSHKKSRIESLKAVVRKEEGCQWDGGGDRESTVASRIIPSRGEGREGEEGYFAEGEIKIKIKKVRETRRSLPPLIFAGIDLEAMQNPRVTQHPSSSSFSSSLMQEEKKRRSLVTEPKMCF